MREIFHDDTMTQFLRRHALRIVIGAALLVAVYGALLAWFPYQRELRIARTIEAHGGKVGWSIHGPDWVPLSLRVKLPFFHRIFAVNLQNQAAPMELTDELLQQLEGMRNLEIISLSNTGVTDAGLEHLKELPALETLRLEGTQVTDKGLEHLIGRTSLRAIALHDTQVTDAAVQYLTCLTNLSGLRLEGTQVTAEGRARIRRALPACRVYPEP